MFRKPKKIQRRVFCADDDEDAEPEPPPPPIISQDKKENKPAKSTLLLSFADEEEEGEMFKVKKSSQSKRLAKRREKEKRKVPDGDNNKYDNNVHEDNGHMDVDQDKPKAKKKVTLEGLILSGREALAADGAGDLSDEGGDVDEEEDEEEGRGFVRYRPESVRAALAGAPGLIPDAALIHAARKTRQQARELGGDYIPVQCESAGGSRLVRDDGSGDDEDEGRLQVRGLDLPSDKPKRDTAAATPDEELNSDVEEWEEQQMQKAMPAIMDITGECPMEVNPFSVASGGGGGGGGGSGSGSGSGGALGVEGGALRIGSRAPATAQDLVDALRTRLEELKTDRENTASKKEEIRDRLLNCARVRESRAARCGELDAAYRRAQAARGYLTDLIECLDEKMPQLEGLEARALALAARRCAFLQERRRADVRDQAHDVLALAARPGSIKPVDSEEKVRRTAEREGRRRARRLRREAAGALPHRDGDSSDDDLPPHELQHFTRERESIRESACALFADALPAWRSVRGACARLARWRRRAPSLYADAYVADYLPKLLAPFIRHQLILWNPLADEDNEDYERMDWYKCLMMYGVRTERSGHSSSDSEQEEEDAPVVVTERSVREDMDLYLVPTIISKLVLPKVTELVEQAWDPMCVRACIRLRQVVERGARAPLASPPLARLAAAVAARLSAAVNNDVFLPTLPPQVLEGAGGPFWRRCVGAGVRLVRAACALAGAPPLLRVDALVCTLIDTLCTAAGAAPGVHAATAAAALADSLPRAGALRSRALPRLAALAALALSRLETDNPLHFKALEQARTIIAEARAAE